MKIKAVIFDLDGLILDSETWGINAIKKTNEVYHYNLPISLAIETIGMRYELISKKWQKAMGKDFDVEKFRAYNKIFMREDAIKNGIKVKSGFYELMNYLKSKGYKTAIASSSLQDRVEFSLKYANIDPKLFDEIITGDMVEHGKPEPDIYLFACKKLGVKIEETIVLEDSDNGVLSSTSAGIKTILIPDIKENSKKVKRLAFKILNNLNEVISILEEINS